MAKLTSNVCDPPVLAVITEISATDNSWTGWFLRMVVPPGFN